MGGKPVNATKVAITSYLGATGTTRRIALGVLEADSGAVRLDLRLALRPHKLHRRSGRSPGPNPRSTAATGPGSLGTTPRRRDRAPTPHRSPGRCVARPGPTPAGAGCRR